MSFLKPTQDSFSLHYNDIINIIANDLNIKPTDLSTSISMKEASTDYFSSGRVAFDSLIVNVKNEYDGETKYHLSENNIKDLIAQHLDLNSQTMAIQLRIEHHPTLGQQINTIECSVNDLSQINSIGDSVKKIESLRKKFINHRSDSLKNNF